MTFSKKYLNKVHSTCFDNYKRIISRPMKCGCFFCGEIFMSDKIGEEGRSIDFPDDTALCPY